MIQYHYNCFPQIFLIHEKRDLGLHVNGILVTLSLHWNSGFLV